MYEVKLNMRTLSRFSAFRNETGVIKESSSRMQVYRQIYPQTGFLYEPSIESDSM